MLQRVDAAARYVQDKEAEYVEAMGHAPDGDHDDSVQAALDGLIMMQEARSLLSQVRRLCSAVPTRALAC